MRKLVLALTLGVGAAHADNGSFYIGAGIARNSMSGISNAGIAYSSINETSWKAFVAFRPISVVAGELDYIDLGSDSGTIFQPGVGTCAVTVPNCATASASSDAKAVAAYAVGFVPIPLPLLEVFGKAGVARWKLNGRTGSVFAQPSSFSNNGTDFAWGVGTQVHFGNIGGRLEYESFRVPSTNGASVVSLTVFLNLY